MDKKLIEEMAREMSACSMGDCFYCNGRHKCIYYKSAEFLYIKGYRKPEKDSVVLTGGEYQKYLAYKIIEPQIRGCLDRERELEKIVENLRSENTRLYERKLELENELTQRGRLS